MHDHHNMCVAWLLNSALIHEIYAWMMTLSRETYHECVVRSGEILSVVKGAPEKYSIIPNFFEKKKKFWWFIRKVG